MNRYEAEFILLFDTMTRIVAYAPDKEAFTRFSQLIYDNLKQYHELYDIYHDYEGVNNIKTINDKAGIAPVKVDKRIIDLLKYAREQYEQTGGRMNVAFGAVLRIWHSYRTEGIDDPDNAKLPPESDLKAAAEHTDISDLVIDEAASTVYLSDPLMSLDVGAIGKGYATEQVSQIAMQKGYTSALISVGGNVRAIGCKGENGVPWSVGIQNPDTGSEDKNLEIVGLCDLSMVTSGSYERFYTVDGQNYHHIIDPDTLFPAVYMLAVTIICRDSGRADALSTAVFNMEPEEGMVYINQLSDVEALWVLNDGRIEYSDHFRDYIKEAS